MARNRSILSLSVAVFLNSIFITHCIHLSSVANKRTNGTRFDTLVKWTYRCVEGFCQKELSEDDNDEFIGMSLETCNVICTNPQLWPLPKFTSTIRKIGVPFNIDDIHFFGLPQDNTHLIEATNIFKKSINQLNGYRFEPRNTESYINIFFNCSNCYDTTLSLETDESYGVTTEFATNVTVKITAATYFGTRHGLETLSQLIWWDTLGNTWQILTDVYIKDRPSFPYRGLMIDTARNFISLGKLKKIVSGMAASKLNVLHLHISDTQSFPLILPSVPELAKFGAYSPTEVYTGTDITVLKEYAMIRGVRLILEVDGPGHINMGWKQMNPNLTVCDDNPMEQGQLNPDNDEALSILQNIYTDLLVLNGQNEIFHIGGDEVNAYCWEDRKAAKNFTDMLSFQVDYMNKMIDNLRVANNNSLPRHIVIWSSQITDGLYVNDLIPNENIAVQYWYGNIRNILISGYPVIYSTVGHWYLDCGFGPWNSHQAKGSCEPYTSWRSFYNYRPWAIYNNREKTLGGEACLWTEIVDEDEIEQKIWPRTAAFAERVWSDPGEIHPEVYMRLSTQRERLSSRGVKVGAIWPQWCTQNPDMC